MKRKVWGFFVLLVCIFGITVISVSAATGDQIVAKAREQIGKPYSSSDRLGPNSFDCSGLVYYVCNQLGISMSSGNCQSQMSYGVAVDYTSFKNSFDRTSLQNGDLIFFDYGGDGIADHVGIYSGDGNMINALTSSYYGYKVVEHSINVTGNSSVSSTKKFWAYTCGIRRVSSNPTPPSNPKLSTNKSTYAIGETVHFTCSANNATGYTIGIYRNGTRIYTNDIGASFDKAFDVSGTYTAYISAWNSYGLVDSAKISFTVYNSKPSNCSLSVNKTLAYINENITFTCSATNATGYTIGINRNGTRILTQDIGVTFTTSFAIAGSYTAYVSAWNPNGLVDSKKIEFTVYDSAPKSSSLQIDKNNITTGQSITFTSISGTATGYTIGINKDGKRIFTQDISSVFLKTFYEAGTYTAYVTAWNAKGICDSPKVTFVVHDKDDLLAASTSTTATRTNSEIEVQTSISNLSQSAQCAIAVYSMDGKLLGNSVTNANNSTQSVTAYFPNYSNAAYVKVFLWDSLKGMKPLTSGEKVDL